LFGGVALNAKAGIGATVEKRGHQCLIGPRRLTSIQYKYLEAGDNRSAGIRVPTPSDHFLWRPTKVAAHNGPVTLMGHPWAIGPKEDADVLGNGDGLRNLSRARARFYSRPDLPNPL
jgi:hypothetical protein